MTTVVRISPARAAVTALALSPVFIIFISSNVVNAGNLLFNVLFSRWMGPELFGELATVLTVKLAILGVLGALQIAVSHRVAKEPAASTPALHAALAVLNRITFVVMWCALPVILGLIWATDLSSNLGLTASLPLILLALSLPFALPMSILRGVAFGALDVKHVLWSANLEMVVRLFAAMAAWQAGLGLSGVVAAIALSIAAGWLPLRNMLRPHPAGTIAWRPLARGLGLAAVPFAMLQASQVVLLDADVILARITLGASDAGYIAALSLFQRIQFFACFGLASVLLPAVSRALVAGISIAQPAGAVATLFIGVSAVVLFATAQFPAEIITAFVGPAFLPVAPDLILAAGAAVAFTLSYLLATFLSAIGDKRGIWLILMACPVQIAAMAVFGETLTQMLQFKLICQIALAALLVTLALGRTLRRPQPAFL